MIANKLCEAYFVLKSLVLVYFLNDLAQAMCLLVLSIVSLATSKRIGIF